jgi:hypothetical protein
LPYLHQYLLLSLSLCVALKNIMLSHKFFFFFGLVVFFIHLFICAYIVGAFLPPPSPITPLASRQNLLCPLLQFCWREDISDNKKDIAFLLVWDKDSYTERFPALLPCTCI